MKHCILASGSPRRKELLEQVNLSFQVRVSDCEEIITKTIPCEIVMELSSQKAHAVAALLTPEEKEDCTLIGADTIVAIGDKILGKPSSFQDAVSMLELLSDSVHQVYTGVTLLHFQNGTCNQKTFYEKTDVYFYPLTKERILSYVRWGDPSSQIKLTPEKKEQMIRAGWMDPSGSWNTENGFPPTCMDKAGAYGIQGAAAAFVKKIDGDYNNVVGLPVARLLWEMESL